jgi:predicted Zn-dependent protease
MNGAPPIVKYGVAAVLLCLYASIAAWIVAGEGKAYRESLALKTSQAPEQPADPVPEVVPAEKPDDSPAKAPEPAPEPSQPPVVAKEPAPSPVAHVDQPPAAPAKKAGPTRKLDPFWNEPDQQKIWDFDKDKFSAADERELGRALHKMILHDHPEVEGGPLQKRMEDAARPYLAAVTRKDVEYTFTVLDCPRLNAFSHPGGYIYVCKGLFDWIAEDEDYALGFILGHEIAHVDLAHAITCMRDPEIKKNFKFGTSLFFFAALIPGGYLKPQDQEADRWVVERMLKDGRTRYEVLAFLRRLEDYAKSNGFENKRKAPTDKPDVPALDNHIRAHPIPRTRIEDAKAIIDRLLARKI